MATQMHAESASTDLSPKNGVRVSDDIVALAANPRARRCGDQTDSEQVWAQLFAPLVLLVWIVLSTTGCPQLQIALVVVCTAVLLGAMRWMMRLSREEPPTHQAESDPARVHTPMARLTCSGHPCDLECFKGLCIETFEPHIVAPRSAWWDRHGAWRLVSVAAVVIIFGRLSTPPWTMLAAMGVLYYTCEVGRFFRPLYYRVVPGRLEMLRWGFLGRGKPQVTVIHLETARITCDLGARTIEIAESSTIADPEVISLWGLGRPLSFAKMIFRAACVHGGPSLPDDALLG